MTYCDYFVFWGECPFFFYLGLHQVSLIKIGRVGAARKGSDDRKGKVG